MTYRIARGAQTFGPYSPAEVERYLASGNIVATDLAQAEEGGAWAPVGQIFPAATGAVPAATRRLFPDPPDLPWWLALIIGLFTGAAFFVVWDVVQSAWLRRAERRSISVFLYIAVAVVYLLKLPDTWHTVDHNMFGGPDVDAHVPGISLIGFALLIAARFVFRSELLRHFNREEPLGTRLNGLWTLLFGGLYFQYKFNRINEEKRRLGTASA
jgi:hypothetical protein